MFDQQLEKLFTLIDDQLNKMAQFAPNDHVVGNTNTEHQQTLIDPDLEIHGPLRQVQRIRICRQENKFKVQRRKPSCLCSRRLCYPAALIVSKHPV